MSEGIMERQPDLEEQIQILRQALEALKPLPLTLDLLEIVLGITEAIKYRERRLKVISDEL